MERKWQREKIPDDLSLLLRGSRPEPKDDVADLDQDGNFRGKNLSQHQDNIRMKRTNLEKEVQKLIGQRAAHTPDLVILQGQVT